MLPPTWRSRLLHLYVERFNRRDWDGLRELISADARLRVADRFAGRLSESPDFGRYERIADWRMALGDVDGRPAIVSLRADGDGWVPQALVRLDIADEQVVRVVDYFLVLALHQMIHRSHVTDARRAARVAA